MKASIRISSFIKVEMTEEQARSIAECLQSIEYNGTYVRSDNLIIQNNDMLELKRTLQNQVAYLDQQYDDDEGDEDE